MMETPNSRFLFLDVSANQSFQDDPAAAAIHPI
jgi:hypothetical protein